MAERLICYVGWWPTGTCKMVDTTQGLPAPEHQYAVSHLLKHPRIDHGGSLQQLRLRDGLRCVQEVAHHYGQLLNAMVSPAIMFARFSL